MSETHGKVSRYAVRPSGYVSGVAPKKPAAVKALRVRVKGPARQPSALVSGILASMDALRRVRGLSQKEMMLKAGSTQQSWSRWTKGQAPRVDVLEAVARSLDADLAVEVRDRRVRAAPRAQAPAGPAGVSTEAIEITALLDRLPDSDRKAVLLAVYREAAKRPPL